MGLLALDCPTQPYAWGKKGLDSSVAQIIQAQGKAVDEDLRFAELWCGTHVNGPAVVENAHGEKQPLLDFLKANPDVVSKDTVQQKECAEDGLPYLFKILSVDTALSIQVHPDKARAAELHKERPEIYKDPNHKPEMACAITPFEALAGFLPISTVLEHILDTPELGALLDVSEEASDVIKSVQNEELLQSFSEEDEREALKVLFSALMTSDPELVAEKVSELKARIEATDGAAMPSTLAARLADQYPGDVGVFCVYFMCYRALEPGQSVFLGANEPHAYLAGDCAEIMACSDNVVRAGLTPKLRDTETLLSTLTYRQPNHSGAEFHPGNLLAGEKRDSLSTVYSPPDPAVTEFQVERIVLKCDETYALHPSNYGSIMLVLEGEADSNTDQDKEEQILKRGDIYFQPCGSETTIVPTSSSGMILFRASKKGAF
eukprot:CAMPEP_0184558118 /NCGR_PEP_ID=MMETSP0199_2-20130426/44644_1 /TAXON_ID=1112570 /ORGANISM="Thraustochytrium sp., Strain LLF1b" /LENGTH=432 /DNA_ID=CAMNT_0026955221 /DNA_START=144 /DNA_END=1442 /DNA_ORIENTATION=-